MAYFKHIHDERRFAGPNGEILAIYDRRRASTLYAPVGVDEEGNICFAGEPRCYFPDEVIEIQNGFAPGLDRPAD